MPDFTLNQLQAINDWQRGFNNDQKPKRIAALRDAAATLHPRYKTLLAACYRQITLEPRYVMAMGLKYQLQETVSSWTLRLDVAEKFKGGVVPEGMDLLPVIFRTEPEPSSVVLNLAALYADDEFLAAVDHFRLGIDRFWDGIGRWRDSQAEVVLDLKAVGLHEVYATGWHSSKRDEILRRPEVQKDLKLLGPDAYAVVERAIAAGAGSFGPRWLKGAAKDRILQKWAMHAERISTRRGAGGTDAAGARSKDDPSGT